MAPAKAPKGAVGKTGKPAKSAKAPAPEPADSTPAARTEVELGSETSVDMAWERLRHKPKPDRADWDRMIAAQRLDRARWMEKERKKGNSE